MIDSFFQELLLAGDNRITHLHDGLLSLLDVLDDLSRGFSMVVFQMWNLLLLVSQLVQQAVTQVAAGNSRRIHLSHYFDGFGEIRAIKAWLIRGPRRRRICRWRRGC